MPPEYVFTTRSAASDRSNSSSSSFARSRGGAPAHVVEPPDHLEVLEAGHVLVDRGVLARNADPSAQPRGIREDVDAVHPCSTAVGLEEGGQNPQRRRLAGAVRPEQAEDRARLDGQVDASKSLHRAVALAKALSLYRRCGHRFTLAKESLGTSGRPALVSSVWPERCDAVVLTSKRELFVAE